MRKACAAVCVLLIAVLLAGCFEITVNAKESPAASAAVEATASPVLPAGTPANTPAQPEDPQPTAIPEPSASIEATASLPAGATATPAESGVTEKALGVVKKAYVKDGVPTIDIDYVAMYCGQEAIEKALEDGYEGLYKDAGGTYALDDDYYIRNNNAKLRTFPLSDSCIIKVVDMSASSVDAAKVISFSKFKQYINDNRDLMHIEVENGFVTLIYEQYTP